MSPATAAGPLERSHSDSSLSVSKVLKSLPLVDKVTRVISGLFEGHSSSIAVTHTGKIIVVSNGKKIDEKGPKITWITSSDDGGKTFSAPEPLFCPDSRNNCSSPVLKVLPSSGDFPGGELLLFVREGPAHDSLASWQKRAKIGEHGGITWDPAIALPKGFSGPTKTPPLLHNEKMLIGSSGESGVMTPNTDWKTWVKVETADLQGKTWFGSHTFTVPGRPFGRGGLEPTFIVGADGTPGILCRDRVKGSVLKAIASKSSTGELTWPNELSPTNLPNPDSGIASLYLAEHHANVIAFNNSETIRAPLDLAVSFDGTETWESREAMTLADAGEFPALALYKENGKDFILGTYAAKVDGVFKIFFTKVPVDAFIGGFAARMVEHIR